MKLISTRGRAPPTDLAGAVFRGPAPDGGLYMPSRIEPLPPASVESFREADGFSIVAFRVLAHLLGGALPPEVLAPLVRDALDFPVPLVEVAEDRWVLELFHGPTLAFKDVGARFLARLMGHYLDGGASGEGKGPVTVLVATSGDTGGAVADAFHGLPGVRVIVLFPRDRVSPRQERQFTTLGGNVRALEVDGSFDDCQRMTTEAFEDPDLRRIHRLTSANSINVGRLLPQVTYYFWAWSRLPSPTGPLVISVPSGNFGNLAAGLLAKRLGLPVTRFVAATNANDVVPEYLGGCPFRPRPSVCTISTAMDVGDPSNFRRIGHLYRHDREALVRDVLGSTHGDDETRECVAEVHREAGYVLDPHSAVGWLGLQAGLDAHSGARGIALGTAHPAKFAETVEPVISRELPVPPALARALEGKRKVTRIAPTVEDLTRALNNEEWDEGT